MINIRYPISVAAAANGNLYVTAWLSNNVLCFTPDGKPKGIMLKKENGLDKPYAIVFSKKSSKVFIVNCETKVVLKLSHY
jgi:sugar lactone lactonase YvrE